MPIWDKQIEADSGDNYLDIHRAPLQETCPSGARLSRQVLVQELVDLTIPGQGCNVQ